MANSHELIATNPDAVPLTLFKEGPRLSSADWQVKNHEYERMVPLSPIGPAVQTALDEAAERALGPHNPAEAIAIEPLPEAERLSTRKVLNTIRQVRWLSDQLGASVEDKRAATRKLLLDHKEGLLGDNYRVAVERLCDYILVNQKIKVEPSRI